MNGKNRNRIGRLLVAALRHDPSLLGIEIDAAGYCSKKEVRKALKEHGYSVTEEELEEILTNERFGQDKKQMKVRVDYGTSLGLKLSDMYETAKTPPAILYHGTSADALESVKINGIVRFAKNGKKPRDHVFLTERVGIALKKGRRYGTGVALPVLADKMQKDGYDFYHAKNDIWLTDHIPPQYIDFANMQFV